MQQQQCGRSGAAGLFMALLVSGCISGQVAASEGGLQELTAEELANYEFEVTEVEATVSELSVGQRYVLSTWRQEIADLVARRLGVVKLRGDKRDLPTLQKLVDKKFIRPGEVQIWQGLGIVFGDLLVREFDLHWVSYQDDLGVSKALRYKKTENYVFPVTLFSKRVGFNETIDLVNIFDKLAVTMEKIRASELGRVRFN